MGTPNFAVPALEKLLNETSHEIVAVYSKEPKISGRGQKINNSPIHNLALKHNLKIFTPKTLKDEKIQEEFLGLNADLAIVVAYGLILPSEILNGTKYGCFNIHPSALPAYRGAAPIQRTVMNGEKETAICIIKMNEGLDSGDIVKEEKYSLQGNETYKLLEEKFAKIGAKLTLDTISDIENNQLQTSKQNDDIATYAHKISKEECQINWREDAKIISQKIRGLSGSIGAYFLYNGEKIKILECEILDEEKENENPGQIIDKNFTISCKKGFIRPTIAQRQGKKAMAMKEILLGLKFQILNLI